MAANIVKVGDAYNAPNHMEYQIAAQGDLSNIDVNVCAVGSVAYMQDLSKIWIFGDDHEWHEV